ncbi:GIY-YIG nuclease family protein [Rhodopila sp.]|uniref:GIY-YIG nuclease family protein n=1 Tax=Rhodopila sp. TaxID=2480087 RepID=UPI003D14A5FD
MAAPIFLTPEPTTLSGGDVLFWLFALAMLIVLLRRRRINLSGKWGRVYVFELVRFPGHYKIGRTSRRTATRQAEVEMDMLGGEGTRLVYVVNVPFSNTVEDLAHQYLRRYRYRCAGTVEMYRYSQWRAIWAVRNAARNTMRAAGWRISAMDKKIAWQQRTGGNRERIF